MTDPHTEPRLVYLEAVGVATITPLATLVQPQAMLHRNLVPATLDQLHLVVGGQVVMPLVGPLPASQGAIFRLPKEEAMALEEVELAEAQVQLVRPAGDHDTDVFIHLFSNGLRVLYILSKTL